MTRTTNKRTSRKRQRLSLEDYAPYLLNRAGVRVATRFSDYLDGEHGISLSAWRVIAALREKDGMTVSDLAETVSIDISTLSRLLSKMNRQQLLTRRRIAPGEGDGRSVRIFLSPAGEDAAAAIIPAALDIETRALAGMTATEIATLKRLLGRLYANLDGIETG